MKKYTARFAYQEADSAREIEATEAEDAALDFAEWAESELDMWEYSEDGWTGDYAVLVTAPDGSVSRWNLRRYYATRFTAREA